MTYFGVILAARVDLVGDLAVGARVAAGGADGVAAAVALDPVLGAGAAAEQADGEAGAEEGQEPVEEAALVEAGGALAGQAGRAAEAHAAWKETKRKGQGRDQRLRSKVEVKG